MIYCRAPLGVAGSPADKESLQDIGSSQGGFSNTNIMIIHKLGSHPLLNPPLRTPEDIADLQRYAAEYVSPTLSKQHSGLQALVSYFNVETVKHTIFASSPGFSFQSRNAYSTIIQYIALYNI